MRRQLRLALPFLLLLAAAPMPAASQERSPPILRIETGMHGSVVNRLALADHGRELITVSDDKTTRSWSLADGAQKWIGRTPIGNGDAGALFAVAAAGDTVVVGGRTNASAGSVSLYVFDRASGQLRGAIAGFAEAVSALAFSAEGATLAVGQQGRGGLVLIDFAGRKIAAVDRAYAGTIEWIAFARDGRIATSAADGKVRLYDPTLRLAAESGLAGAGAAEERPWGLAFSPDGETLAVGSLEKPTVRLLAATNLRPLRTLHGAGQRPGGLSVVAWSSDGGTLAAGGSYKDALARRLIAFWNLRGGEAAPVAEAAVARDTLTDLALLDAGRAVYVSAEPSFGVVGRDGREAMHRGPEHCDFRDAWQDAYRVSRDGAVVDFPSEQGGNGRFRFDLLAGTLSANPPPRDDLKRATVDDPRLKLANWRNATAPTLNGRAIAVDSNEHVRSVAILPGAESAAIGTDFYLRLERKSGEAWRQVLAAPAWSVNVSGDGRFVLAALGDGTIRWYAVADGREVMSLFVDPKDRRWVVWVPQGFFDHSQETTAGSGETLVGYHLDNGPGKAANFVAIGQLYGLFYRRDLVLANFRGGRAEERKASEQLARYGDVRDVLKTGLPPRLELIEACIRTDAASACPPADVVRPARGAERKIALAGAGDRLVLRYQVEDQGGGLGRVIIRRDGAVIRGVPTDVDADAHHRTETVALPLHPGGDTIRLATESGNGSIQSGGLDEFVIAAAPGSTPSGTAPAGDVQLFVAAIGVSRYLVPAFRLDNAANDARAVGELLAKPSPPVYGEAHVTTLLDDEATAANITRALERVAALARPQDIVVIFLAGHGEAVEGKYFFAPVDFAATHPQAVREVAKADEKRQGEIIDDLFRQDGYGEATLLPLLEKIQGYLLLVLDTCYSGTLTTLDREQERARHDTVVRSVGHEIGRIVLAGARTLALDSSGDGGGKSDGHGLFTYYFLKGLGGEADSRHVGRVKVHELVIFTQDRVREESRKLNADQEASFFFMGNTFFDLRAVSTTP